MLEAAGWGLLGASSLLIGAVIGARVRLPKQLVGLVLAFGAGTLISAITFELTEEAFELGGADTVALGLGLGAIAFYLGDRLIERRGGRRRGRMAVDSARHGESGTALMLGATLDGIPESAVIGTSLIGGGAVGVPVLVAVFLSNLPEAIGAEAESPRRPLGRVLAPWAIVVAASTAAAAIGFGALDGASDDVVGLLQSFAAGAVLVMLVDEMIPTSLRQGGSEAGLVATLGFALAYLLSTV
jgi:zinc transporter, ZIP family